MLKNILKKRKLIVSSIFIAALTAPQISSADCTQKEIEKILIDNGWSYEIRDPVDDNVVRVALRKDGAKAMLFVESDGDMSFRSWFMDGEDYSLSQLNRANGSYKYIKAVMDEDDDIRVGYDVPVWGNSCSSDFSEHIGFWWDMREGMVDKLTED